MACTTGRGEAQHRKCVQCPGGYFMLKPPMRHGACVAGGYDKPREQDADLYDDESKTCPMGYWSGLPAVDLEAERAASKKAQDDAQVARIRPLIAEVAPSAKTPEEVRAVVTKFATAGMLSAEAADRIEKAIVAERTDARV